MRIKRLLLCFLMIVSAFCVVSCKNNEGNKPSGGKQDPVVQVDYNRAITRYAGDRLGDIALLTIGNSTVGTLYWENPDALLELGTKNYKWVFVPTNATKYNSKSGYLSISAHPPLLDPQVSGVDYLRDSENLIFIDAPLSTVKFKENYNSLIDGTFSWSNPSQILKSDEDTNGVGNICTWLFTPSDSSYKVVSGTLIIHATEEQMMSSISVGDKTKTSGYVAFDEFETDDLTIIIHYEAGKEVEVENPQGYSIAYKSDNRLRRGDDFVTLQYLGMTCNINIDPVGIKEIDIPEFTGNVIYNGGSQPLQIDSSADGFYDFDREFRGTNAGVYNLRVWLEYENDLKWKGTDESEVFVECLIKEAPHTITPNKYTGTYDGEAHASTVSGEVNKVEAIYYSAEVELTAENYEDAGSKTAPTFVNVNTNAEPYIVYYYAVGEVNYLDVSGTVEVQINPQAPNISLKYLYTLQTGSAIHYPDEYVTVRNHAGDELPKGELTFTYYQRYHENPTTETPNVLTQPQESGSANFGKAPRNHREDSYYVVVKYAGDNANYAEASAYTTFYIDSTDNGLYPLVGIDKFAFKEIKSGDESSSGFGHTIVGTNTEECKAYIEFSPSTLVLGNSQLIELEFESKFSNVHGQVKSGKLMFKDGAYYIVYSDESRARIELSSDKNTLEVSFTNFETIELSKWEIPTFIDETFVAQTIDSVTEGKNTSQNTEITFINDYGTIRFSAKVNTPYTYDEAYDDEEGGYEEWGGVVVTKVEYNNGYWYTLTCYILSSNSLESTGFNTQNVYFKLKWSVLYTTPTSITLEGGSKIRGLYECLEGSYIAQ